MSRKVISHLDIRHVLSLRPSHLSFQPLFVPAVLRSLLCLTLSIIESSLYTMGEEAEEEEEGDGMGLKKDTGSNALDGSGFDDDAVAIAAMLARVVDKNFLRGEFVGVTGWGVGSTA